MIETRPEGQENLKMGESGRIEVELTQVLLASEANDNMPFQNKDQLLPKVNKLPTYGIFGPNEDL